MCREIFGKRIVPFSFSFFLGLIFAAFAALQEIPSVEVEEEITSIHAIVESDNEKGSNLKSEKLNCIPANPDLKYLELAVEEKGILIPKGLKPETEKSSNQIKISKNNTSEIEKLSDAETEDLREIVEEIEKQLRESSGGYALDHKLLYTEYCFESNGRK